MSVRLIHGRATAVVIPTTYTSIHTLPTHATPTGKYTFAVTVVNARLAFQPAAFLTTDHEARSLAHSMMHTSTPGTPTTAATAPQPLLAAAATRSSLSRCHCSSSDRSRDRLAPHPCGCHAVRDRKQACHRTSKRVICGHAALVAAAIVAATVVAAAVVAAAATASRCRFRRCKRRQSTCHARTPLPRPAPSSFVGPFLYPEMVDPSSISPEMVFV